MEVEAFQRRGASCTAEDGQLITPFLHVPSLHVQLYTRGIQDTADMLFRLWPLHFQLLPIEQRLSREVGALGSIHCLQQLLHMLDNLCSRACCAPAMDGLLPAAQLLLNCLVSQLGYSLKPQLFPLGPGESLHVRVIPHEDALGQPGHEGAVEGVTLCVADRGNPGDKVGRRPYNFIQTRAT